MKIVSLQISVVVLIYNGSWERIRATLNSIIMQKDIKFELIIMDDCSDAAHIDEIKEFLANHSVIDYRLIVHKENIGIIRTCLEAAQESKTEYVRLIGQGDMFFDESTLKDSYDFMRSYNAELIAGKAVYYHAYSNPVEIYANYRWPQNIKAYDNPDDLRESYLLHDDRVSGATTFYKRDLLLEYMTEAVEKGMRYVEDFMIKCMVFDKRRIYFFDRNVIYYEAGAGISTGAMDELLANKIKKIHEETSRDVFYTDDLLLERCKNFPSKFSSRLAKSINTRRALQAKRKTRQIIKKKLGIFALPIVLMLRVLRKIKSCFQPSSKPVEFIKTDINVSTEFANLCMNQE